MIVVGLEILAHVLGRYSIGQDVMDRLYVERFFDLGVRGD